MTDSALLYAKLPLSRTWISTDTLAMGRLANGTKELVRMWRCRETGEIEWRPIEVVDLPLTTQSSPPA